MTESVALGEIESFGILSVTGAEGVGSVDFSIDLELLGGLMQIGGILERPRRSGSIDLGFDELAVRQLVSKLDVHKQRFQTTVL